MEDRTWQLIKQGMKDIKQWIADAPTPEAKAYREQKAADILLSKEPAMHYYRDGLDTHNYNWQQLDASGKQINEEYGDSHV